MNHIRFAFIQHGGQIGEVLFDRKSLIKLPRHQRLTIADPDDFDVRNPLDLGRMRIRYLAAPDYRSPKH